MSSSMITINDAVLHVTSCCGHHCPFCYAIDDGQKHFHQDVNILMKIISRLRLFHCSSLLLVGGDPASHPNIIELAVTARECGMEVGILSNTLDFNGYKPNYVASKFDYIEATIHSSQSSVHDSFCNCHGAFRHVVENLRSFADGSAHLGIVFNVTPSTYLDILPSVKRMRDMESVPIDHVVLQRIAPVGRADGNTSWQIKKEMLPAVFSQIEQIKNKYGVSCRFEDAIPYCVLPSEYKQYTQKCVWGFDAISLDMYGNFSSCCTDPRYSIGNILDESFQEAWRNSKAMVSRRSGELLPEQCRNCREFSICGGGCLLANEFNGCKGDPIAFDNCEGE